MNAKYFFYLGIFSFFICLAVGVVTEHQTVAFIGLIISAIVMALAGGIIDKDEIKKKAN